MLNFRFTDVPDIDKYAEDIGAAGTRILVDPLRMSLMCDNISAKADTSRNLVSTYMYQMSHQLCSDPSKKQELIDTLVKCGCDPSNFLVEGANGQTYSVDKTKVLGPMLTRLVDILNNGSLSVGVEDAVILLQAYLDYKTRTTLCNAANSKLKKLSEEEYEGWNVPLNAVSFKYEQKETGRFYTYDDSIQNWQLELCHAITAEKDYFLFWCDFDQIDFRVGYHLYLREPGSEADKIYLAAEDKYRAMYEIICRSAGKEPDFDLFTRYRKSYKKAILSAMYNASEQSLIADIQNKELGHELYEFFKHNERYQRFRRSIDKIIDFNTDITVSDYFNFQRTIPIPAYKNPRAIADTVAKCCNTPIQSTSNSIMILWLEAVLNMFEAQGYSRKTDVVPYLIRHDECIFKIHKRVIPELWRLADCMSLAIDNWDILTLEPHCGLYYKEPHEAFEQLYNQSVDQNKDKFTGRTVNEPRDTVYRPVQEVVDVYVFDTRSPKTLATAFSVLHPEVDLAEFGVGSINNWTEEQCVALIKFAADKVDKFYDQYLRYYNKMVIYSHKLNKYQCIPNMDYAIAIAKKIGSNKINCFNLDTTNAYIQDDIMFRLRNDRASKVKHIFSVMEENNFTTDWITI